MIVESVASIVADHEITGVLNIHGENSVEHISSRALVVGGTCFVEGEGALEGGVLNG
jgi:hypothetical protein